MVIKTNRTTIAEDITIPAENQWSFIRTNLQLLMVIILSSKGSGQSYD